MHRSKFSTFFLSTFIVLLLATLIPSAQAQDPTPPPTIDPESPAAIELREASQRAIDIFTTLFSQTQITDYHIVYLVAPDVANIDMMQAYTGAQIASDWETVVQIDNARPIDALIVHASRADAVDTGWTQDAYQNRAVLLVAINRHFQTMAEWTGDNCSQATEIPFEEDYYVMQRIEIQSSDSELRAQLLTATLTQCDIESRYRDVVVPEDTPTTVDTYSFQYTINSSEEYEIFVANLLNGLFF